MICSYQIRPMFRLLADKSQMRTRPLPDSDQELSGQGLVIITLIVDLLQ